MVVQSILPLHGKPHIAEAVVAEAATAATAGLEVPVALTSVSAALAEAEAAAVAMVPMVVSELLGLPALELVEAAAVAMVPLVRLAPVTVEAAAVATV